MREDKIQRIRQENIIRLIEIHGGNADLTDASETDPGYISQIKNGTRGMAEKAARGFEKRYKPEWSPGWLDMVGIDFTRPVILQNFNDLHLHHPDGLKEVKRQLEAAVESIDDDNKSEIQQLYDNAMPSAQKMIKAFLKDHQKVPKSKISKSLKENNSSSSKK